MQFLADEITEFTQAVWASMLDSEITTPASASDPEAAGSTLTACVQVAGAWNGALVVHCGEETARAAACVMLQLEPGDAGADEVADVLGELANMIGGNVKALLPHPATLGLPSVVGGKEYSMHLPGSREVTRIDFEWQGAPVVVQLLKCDEQPDESP